MIRIHGTIYPGNFESSSIVEQTINMSKIK